jgi:lysophospholipase L1-like esterase
MTEKFHIFTKTAISLFITVIIIVSVSNSDAAIIKKIIGFGDSITSGRPYSVFVGGGRQGYGGYEPVLEQLLSDAMRESYVYNWGYGGEDTRVGVNRIESVLNSQESDYVLIMEGTNDQWYGISVVTTAFNLGKMIDKCRASGTIPILGNLTPADRDTSNQIPNIYNPAIADVAQQKDAIFVDHYSAVVDRWHELHYDSVHPNLEGYEEIAKTWYHALVELINPPFNIGAIQLLLSD